jgi:thiamine transporter
MGVLGKGLRGRFNPSSTVPDLDHASGGIKWNILLPFLAWKGFFIGGIKMKKSWLSIQEMTLMAMLIALALVLDRLIVFQQPQGGSINISMVALLVIVIRFGFWKSLFANALVYGLIANLLDGWGLITYPLDYFLALASLSIFAVVVKELNSNKFITRQINLFLGFLCAVLFRLLFHTISGVVLYDVDWLGSFIYNTSYLLPSFLLSWVVLGTLIETKQVQSILFSNR